MKGETERQRKRIQLLITQSSVSVCACFICDDRFGRASVSYN